MKHLLTLTDLTKSEINNILEVATQMRRVVLTNFKKGPQLIGHVVAGVWEKPCTSSTAFQLASAYLSGTCCPVFGADDVLTQCNTLDNMGVNTMVVTMANDSLAQKLAAKSRAAVINGGSAQFDPIGVLADLMTLNLKLDGLKNLNVLLLGNRDVNKINELTHCLQMFGSNVLWYLPAEDIATQRRGVVINKAEAAFAGADAVLDLGLSQFCDAEKYYGSSGGVSQSLLDKARINCPLLGNRYVVDKMGIREYVYNAVNTRESCYVAVAMAVLYLIQKN